MLLFITLLYEATRYPERAHAEDFAARLLGVRFMGALQSYLIGSLLDTMRFDLK